MTDNKPLRALVVGAGLGGLATALRLATRGYDVTIVERHHRAGGRLNLLEKDGFRFDVGPSFFSMSYEFDELFKYCGVPNPLRFEELDPIYGVYFEGRTEPLLIHKDPAKLAATFAEMEPNFEAKLKRYLDKAQRIFHDTEHRIIKRNFSGLPAYLGALATVPPRHLPMLFRSMWDELVSTFDSYEARVVFSLVAFFLGGTPYETPAVYSLLNYTELRHDGYWHVKGGMYDIVVQLLRLLDERGVRIHYHTHIASIEEQGGKATAAIDSAGRRFEADLFVVNSDAASFRGQVLHRPAYSEEKLDAMTWTLAPFTMYLGVKGNIDGLYHHTYFLGRNFGEYAKDIFKTASAPRKPYYYVNVASKSNPDCAPPGHENVFILCPVPDLRHKPDWADAEQLASDIIADFGQRVGYDVAANIVSQTIYTPTDWMDMFNLYKGSGLGLAHGLMQVGGMRPRNKDERLANVYYVGASTIPGTGLPIVVIGSRLVTERILDDYPTANTRPAPNKPQPANAVVS